MTVASCCSVGYQNYPHLSVRQASYSHSLTFGNASDSQISQR